MKFIAYIDFVERQKCNAFLIRVNVYQVKKLSAKVYFIYILADTIYFKVAFFLFLGFNSSICMLCKLHAH